MDKIVKQKIVLYIRWTARIAGTALVAFFLFFVVAHIFSGGEDNLKLNGLTAREMLLFAAMIIQLVGLIAAWPWEGVGALITLIGYLAFSIIDKDFWNPPIFPLFPAVAVLYGYCWLRSRDKGDSGVV